MGNKFQVGVIGLGKFGYMFGKTLVEHGHEIMGVDINPDLVKKAQHVFTQVYEADASNKATLVQLGFAEMTHVLVSVGDSIAASSMISMYLKEFAVPQVWVKAINGDHAKLLKKIGVDEVFIPENLAAKQLAFRIANPGFIEYLPFDRSMAIEQFQVKEWAGKRLKDIDLTNRFNIQVIAIRKASQASFRFIPKADDLFEKDDTLVVIGSIERLKTLKS